LLYYIRCLMKKEVKNKKGEVSTCWIKYRFSLFPFSVLLIGFYTVFFLSACNNAKDEKFTPAALLITEAEPVHFEKVPDISVNKADPNLTNRNGVWRWKENIFSGYIITKDQNVLIEKIPILKGKENGVWCQWYPNGKKKSEQLYLEGNREGTHTGWWENDSLRFVYHFVHDRFHGEHLSFFKNGKKWTERHYENGYEEGTQRAWNYEGRMVTNFTIKKGKLYGVIGRFDCISVKND
jgi:hypothetical protein